ncbi:Lipase EstA/Esterase EstB family-containing protein [Aphelenchoides besseyi]|nr:Lipase EstA/Esterase EstB family-containing protein [Aphelenchoides besseyi]KAI6193085.1 Lipase EstA/Esterase EstB family-containing protein [Aphelenchoides besseyi]
MQNKLAVSLLLFISATDALLSPTFRQFLRENYGPNLESELTRADVGESGSFGGGRHTARTPTDKRPVILVHGITNQAGTFGPIRQYFLEHNYQDAEVYATTYGDAGKTNVIFVTMNCHYVKMVRALIQTVADFTSSKVNVIGYSMGSPIARKAIMGGACVETGENLGSSLSHLVHVYIGVAGANFGSFLCILPIGSCNLINGMACGSRYLNDINARQRYEGQFIYTIASTGDEKVGYQACGREASAIVGQNGKYVKNGLNHDQLMFSTVEMQYNLVTHNHE